MSLICSSLVIVLVATVTRTENYCGLQHYDDYIHADNRTGIDEFPWLAALVYKSSNGGGKERKTLCAGSLISEQYVLTAAYCLNIAEHKLTAVRLGEYDLTQHRDCVQTLGLAECTIPAEYRIIETVQHPDYSEGLTIPQNDVALVRVHAPIEYSDYIRPVCLPSVSDTKSVRTGDILTSTGWNLDIFPNSEEQSKLKKKTFNLVISNQDCTKAYSYRSRDILNLTDNHMCTSELGINTDFSCASGFGGPLLVAYKVQFRVEGIWSFARPSCSGEYPIVYTRVAGYSDWIRQNMRP